MLGRWQQPLMRRTVSAEGGTPSFAKHPDPAQYSASSVAEAPRTEHAAPETVNGDPAGSARTPRGHAGGGSPEPGPTGDGTPHTHAVLGVDTRLWLICAYAFLIAVNNTSLRPVLPSFVKV